jgi:hypothetical protein
MDFWEDLLDYVKEGRVVPVIGPELLKTQIDGRDVLLYHHVAEQLAQELQIETEGLPANYKINDIVCRYLQRNAPNVKIYKRIRDILARTPVTVPPALTKLARIAPFQLFVTTTFDSLMEKALNDVRFGGADRALSGVYFPSQRRDKGDPQKGEPLTDFDGASQPLVFHLFGKASVGLEYVATDEDTLEFISTLQQKRARPDRLFDELKINHLLFIGTSFSDWLARFFIRLTRGERFLAAGLHQTIQYLADEQMRKDSNFILFLESFGRDHAEIYTDSGPIEFVNELFDRCEERYPEIIVGEGSTVPAAMTSSQWQGDTSGVVRPPPPPGHAEIFLSYAREDSDATHRIAEALEAAGLTVWLDRSRIKHGEEWSDKINQNIAKCFLFFPILSHTTNRRREGVFFEEWKCAEIREGRLRPGTIFIVPIPIDDSEVPSRFGSKHYEVFPKGQLTPEFIAWIKQVLADLQRPLERP